MRPILRSLTISLLLTSCFTSMYHSREPALVENVNIDETLKIACDEMEKDGMSQALGIWVLRDQIVTPEQAKTVADLYLTHIDSMTIPFNVWHSSWAISNLYRLGDDSVKVQLADAWQKAKVQPQRLKGGTRKIANSHINGDKIVTGFIHAGGRAYAKRHLVVPGNKRYVQSYEEYRARQEK